MHDYAQDSTTLFRQFQANDAAAREAIFRRVYDELRNRAGRLSKNPADSLTPTSLVHEALLKIFEANLLESVADRNHLLAVATRAMRQVLIDHYRAGKTRRRGREWVRHPLDVALDRIGNVGYDPIQFDEAIGELAKLSERQARIIELRIIYEMTHDEIAENMGVSRSLVEKEWRSGLSWLKVWIQESQS